MSEQFNQMIRDELKKRGISESAASERSGLSRGALNSILSKPESNPESDTVKKLAAFFGFDEDYVLGLTGHRTPEEMMVRPFSFQEWLHRAEMEAPVAIKVYDQLIHAGEGAVPQDYIYMPPEKARGKTLIAGYAQGDCMEPAIFSGDMIVIDTDASPKANNVVVVRVENTSVEVKRLISIKGSTLTLGCDNPKYDVREVQDAAIIGVVIQATRPLV